MKKIITVILDGVGIREENHGNAVKQASMTNFVKLWNEYPHALLKASQRAVGLRKGQFGNSEVGHLTIGAGRLIKQKITVIDELFANNRINNNMAFQDMIEYTKDNEKRIHLMLLASDGGVHSELEFLFNALESLKSNDVKDVVIHLISDGRDTEPMSAFKYVKEVEDYIKKIGLGKIADICGRYYAMDRDKNYTRTKLYYDLITKEKGLLVTNLKEVLNTCYEKKVTDEFIPPLIINKGYGIKNGEVIWWLNYRNDRAKQILKALKDPSFSEFPTVNMVDTKLYSFYKVDNKVPSINLLDEFVVENPLGEYLANLGLTQARIAETEKYAHVTYFFDGGKELKLENCDRYLIASPKVATYDLKPEMSAVDITKKAIKCMENDYDFILVNYANGDMVGHTGVMDATIKALEAVDVCLGKLYEAAEENFYTMVILADHGNADVMLDDDNHPVTTHSLSSVPFIITDKKLSLSNGNLTMVAPTILKYMDIAIPKEMKETEILIDEE